MGCGSRSSTGGSRDRSNDRSKAAELGTCNYRCIRNYTTRRPSSGCHVHSTHVRNRRSRRGAHIRRERHTYRSPFHNRHSCTCCLCSGSWSLAVLPQQLVQRLHQRNTAKRWRRRWTRQLEARRKRYKGGGKLCAFFHFQTGGRLLVGRCAGAQARSQYTVTQIIGRRPRLSTIRNGGKSVKYGN